MQWFYKPFSKRYIMKKICDSKLTFFIMFFFFWMSFEKVSWRKVCSKMRLKCFCFSTCLKKGCFYLKRNFVLKVLKKKDSFFFQDDLKKTFFLKEMCFWTRGLVKKSVFFFWRRVLKDVFQKNVLLKVSFVQGRLQKRCLLKMKSF